MYLIVVFGMMVLLTYVEAFRSENAAKLWGRLPRLAWVISTVLTVLSFLYMTGMWIFAMENELLFGQPFAVYRHYVMFCYVLFMSGAVLWSPTTLLALKREENMLLILLVLWLTALGAVGIFVMTCGLEKQAMMCVCGAVVMFHHVVFDAIWWWYTFDAVPTPLLDIGLDTGHRADFDYDTLQYI